MAHYGPNNPQPHPQPGPPYQQQRPQPGWQPAPPYPPQPVRRGRRWLSHSLTAFIALLGGVGIGASGETQTAQSAGPRPTVTVAEKAGAAPTVTETVTAEPEQTQEAETQAAGPAAGMPGDGQFLVGEDIRPGTYKTVGTARDGHCYWARLKDASGEFGAIIANDNIAGPTRVTVKKGEYFETNGCQGWKRVG